MDKLDQEILSWIAQRTDSAELKTQLDQAKVARRDYMRTGFFVYFERQSEIPAIPGGLVVQTPHIDSAQLLDGAGTSLFLRDGRLHYLEIYARGGFFPEQLEEFSLREAD